MSNSSFQVGGSLANNAPCYVVRRADRQLYEALLAGEFCYVFDSRQMGKSSLLVKTRFKLQAAKYKCSTIDMTSIGSENIQPNQWYKGILAELWRTFKLSRQVDFKQWWQEQDGLSDLQKLSRFIRDVLLLQFPHQKIVIFIDEIDSILSLDFPVDDFFALIRFCFNQRSLDPEYNRITFAIFGVAIPGDLIRDRHRTPFNIGTEIKLEGFQFSEIQPLISTLERYFANSSEIVREILRWTNGQPFLTQKICQLLIREQSSVPNSSRVYPLEEIVDLIETKILQNWEAQDRPEHLKTIRDRILVNEQKLGKLLGTYQRVLAQTKILANDSTEHIELQLSGLVKIRQGYLQVRNNIYGKVFDLVWVTQQLSSLRPYNESLQNWLNSQRQDTSRLLRGKALADAQVWMKDKSLTDLDYQFLAASQDLDRQELEQLLEAKNAQEMKARLIAEQKNARLQKFLLGIVSTALLGAIAFSWVIWQQNRRFFLKDIEATAISSERLLASNQDLDALVEGIRAKRKLEQLGKQNKAIAERVNFALRQAIYRTLELNRLNGHDLTVWRVAFSPNGKTIATASIDSTVKIWLPNGKLVATLQGHNAEIRDLDFSPDSQTIITASLDKTAKLWNLNGKEIATFKDHNADVRTAAFSPDGQIIATGSGDRTIKLWQPDGTLIKTIEGHKAEIHDLKFSPNGKFFATASADDTVKLWNIEGKEISTIPGSDAAIRSLAFSPDGNILATASADSTVKLWFISDLKPSMKFTKPAIVIDDHNAEVRGVVFSPDGKTLATASADKTLRLWKLDGSSLAVFYGHNAEVRGVDFSPDGKTLISSDSTGTVKLWQLNHPLMKIVKSHQATARGLAFSPDGQIVATTSLDNTVKLWTRGGKLIKILRGHTAGIQDAVFTIDSQQIITASEDGTAKLWNFQGKVLKTFRGHRASLRGIDLSPSGKIFATSSLDSTVRLWNLSGELIKTIDGHTSAVWKVAFHPNGQFIATASEDKTVKFWGLDGNLIKTFEAHSTGVRTVNFSPDGKIIATSGGDKIVKLWDQNGDRIATLRGHTAALRYVAFDPDGRSITTASLDNTIKIWQLNGKLITTLQGHSSGVRSISYSPDGEILASISDDANLILWNIAKIKNIDLLDYSCKLVKDFLENNSKLEESDRQLCKDI